MTESNKISILDMIFLDSELAIKWSDMTESYIPLKILREKCPCANCSGEKDVFGNVYKGKSKPLNQASYKVINLSKIGHYALRIFWADGHSEGLFTFDLLRKLENEVSS